MSIKEFLDSERNSFDSLLQDYDNMQPLYACPVLATNQFSYVYDSCPMFWDLDKGFFLKEDKIIPNVDLHGSDDLIPQLYLKSSSRFYNTYVEDKHIGMTYTFYSKLACHKIYQFFDEDGEGTHGIEPFSYKRMPSFFEDPNNLPDWLIEGMINEDNVIGMVCIEASVSKERIGVFSLLFNRPRKMERLHKFDLYEIFDYQKVYLESSYLKSYNTKILVWAFVHDLKKGTGLAKLQVIGDEENARNLHSYIRCNYERFTDEKKDECVLLYPDEYKKFTPSDEIYQRLVIDTVMSMATTIRRWGLGGSYAVAAITGDESVTNLMVTTIKKIDNNKKITLKLPCEYQFPLTIVLSFMNMMYGENIPIKAPLGFWLYYLLFEYRKRCSQEELPFINTLMVFTLRNNLSSFAKFFSVIKQKTFIEEIKTKGFFGTKVKTVSSDWISRDNNSCVFELIYYFSGNGETQWDKLSSEEQQFWSRRLDNEIEYEAILQQLQRDGQHTTMGIEKQREFYASQLYEAIKSEIDNNNFYMRDYN